MNRFVIFVAVAALASPLFGQMQVSGVPPGFNYDPAKHVNPVITYVESKDFKPSNYKDAEEATGHSLLGLSKETGSLESVAVADLGGKPPKDLRLPVPVAFYPVVQQTFKLVEGGTLILHSLKPPKIQGGNFPPQGRSSIGLPFPLPRRGDPKDKRFGPVTPPEELEIRGLPGLLFEKDGTITVAWMEDGIYYTASSSLSSKALFVVLDDLL